MAAALKEVLRKTLDNLSVTDFKRFKHHLRDQGPIPWGKLEKADTDDTVDSMVQTYTIRAVDVMVAILKKMNHNQLATDLETDLGKLRGQEFFPGLAGGTGQSGQISMNISAGMVNAPAFSDCTINAPLTLNFGGAPVPQDNHTAQPDALKKSSLKQKLQGHLRNRFSAVHQESGDYYIQDIYTELYIVKGRTGGVDNTHEVSTINMRQIGRGTSSDDVQIKLANIFAEACATKVLSLGIAGVGKTVAVQKFVMDWAEKKANQDIDFVFVFLFRELNLKKMGHYSLFDLLLLFYPDLKGVEKFPEFSECKILFVFDGLDESSLQMDFEAWISDPNQISSVDIITTSLIKGMLLPSSLIWVTTRPAAASLIPRECFNMVTELRGFNDPQKIEFFQKNVRNKVKANGIIDHVKKNKSLFIMCHIPVFCHLIASVLIEILDSQGIHEAPKTLTEMYTFFCISQINRMKDKYSRNMSPEERGQLLVKLGKLAFMHLENGTLIFYAKDLKKCDIDIESEALQSGVCTQIFKMENDITGESIFSFVHLSVQEFLASLYVLHESVHGNNPLLETSSQDTNSPSSRLDLYKMALKKALQSKNGHLDLFVRFLLGLAPMLEPEIRPPLDVLLPRLAVREESIKKTVRYIRRKINEDISSERIINLFHCLNELGDNSMVKQINRYINSTEEDNDLTPAQCSALAYLLLMSAEDLEEFDLKKYLRSEEGLHRMLPVVKVCKSVWLDQCHLSKKSRKMLASVLQGTPSRLRLLDISDNDLQDEGVELLCVGLTDPQCKLETMRLSQCHISKETCKLLESALLRTPSHLRELDMTDNDLQDEGVELLCRGLQDPQCKLEILRLSGCMITHKGCSSLTSSLKSNPSYLKELDLSYNHPGDSGVKELTYRLNDPSCKLVTLRYACGGQNRIRPGKRKYACQLTLDPATACMSLLLSEGNRKVTWEETWQQYTDHPERFDYWDQVLCREGLSGRCYWEAEWSGNEAVIAMAYKSIGRKMDESRFGYNDKSWSLSYNGDRRFYTAWHSHKETFIPAPFSNSKRVGVYLDSTAGTLSFYSVSSDTLTHLHTFHSTFTEPLYPGFGLRDASSAGTVFAYYGSYVTLCQIT